MAITTVVPTVLSAFNTAEEQVALAAVDATLGARIPLTEADQKVLIRIQNSGEAAATATIKAGDSLFGSTDKTLSLGIGKTYEIQIESGPYKKTTGTNKGYVEITGSANTVKVGATTLP